MKLHLREQPQEGVGKVGLQCWLGGNAFSIDAHFGKLQQKWARSRLRGQVQIPQPQARLTHLHHRLTVLGGESRTERAQQGGKPQTVGLEGFSVTSALSRKEQYRATCAAMVVAPDPCKFS